MPLTTFTYPHQSACAPQCSPTVQTTCPPAVEFIAPMTCDYRAAPRHHSSLNSGTCGVFDCSVSRFVPYVTVQGPLKFLCRATPELHIIVIQTLTTLLVTLLAAGIPGRGNERLTHCHRILVLPLSSGHSTIARKSLDTFMIAILKPSR